MLPRGTVLRDGDACASTDGRVVIACAPPTRT